MARAAMARAGLELVSGDLSGRAPFGRALGPSSVVASEVGERGLPASAVNQRLDGDPGRLEHGASEAPHRLTRHVGAVKKLELLRRGRPGSGGLDGGLDGGPGWRGVRPAAAAGLGQVDGPARRLRPGGHRER